MSAQPASLLLLGCVLGCASSELDPMEIQQRVNPYDGTTFFTDGRAMRPPPPGTIPMEHLPLRSPLTAWGSPSGGVARMPVPVTATLMQLGRSRYDVVCAACHGLVGDGDSVPGKRMSLRPAPSFHQPRLRALGDGDLYRVILEGYGLMPAYAAEVPAEERWAVVAYVRALQRSQGAKVDDVPEDQRDRLEGGAP